MDNNELYPMKVEEPTDLGMGKCSVRGCSKEAVILWPLVEGNPSLCPRHLSEPPPMWRELVEAYNEPPDDFDPYES